jgi:Uma2 family endonuclease
MSAILKIAAEPDERRYTWEEYEALESESGERHEFVDGRVYAMAGGTDNHNRISLNIAASLLAKLRGKSCEPFHLDMKLKLELGLSIRGYYPDVIVICNPEDNNRLHRKDPTVVIEVLSENTERVGRHEKLMAYQALPNLQVYVLASQTARALTVHRRANNWQPERIAGSDNLQLDAIGVTMTLDEIYERTAL